MARRRVIVYWSKQEIKNLLLGVVKYGQCWMSILGDPDLNAVFIEHKRIDSSLKVKWMQVRDAQLEYEADPNAPANGVCHLLQGIVIDEVPNIGDTVGIPAGWTAEENDAFDEAIAALGINGYLYGVGNVGRPLLAAKTYLQWKEKCHCSMHDVPGAEMALRFLQRLYDNQHPVINDLAAVLEEDAAANNQGVGAEAPVDAVSNQGTGAGVDGEEVDDGPLAEEPPLIQAIVVQVSSAGVEGGEAADGPLAEEPDTQANVVQVSSAGVEGGEAADDPLAEEPHTQGPERKGSPRRDGVIVGRHSSGFPSDDLS